MYHAASLSAILTPLSAQPRLMLWHCKHVSCIREGAAAAIVTLSAAHVPGGSVCRHKQGLHTLSVYLKQPPEPS